MLQTVYHPLFTNKSLTWLLLSRYFLYFGCGSSLNTRLSSSSVVCQWVSWLVDLLRTTIYDPSLHRPHYCHQTDIGPCDNTQWDFSTNTLLTSNPTTPKPRCFETLLFYDLFESNTEDPGNFHYPEVRLPLVDVCPSSRVTRYKFYTRDLVRWNRDLMNEGIEILFLRYWSRIRPTLHVHFTNSLDLGRL